MVEGCGMGSSPDTSGGGSHGDTHPGSPAAGHHQGALPPPYSGASASPSTLSPAAEPFFPSISSEDRGMAKRWMDFSDDSDSDDNIDEVIDTDGAGAASQTPYLDAVCRSPAPVPRPALCSIVVQPPRGEGGHRKRPRRRGRRPPPPSPQMAKRRSRRSSRQRGATEMVVGLQRKAGQVAATCDRGRAALRPPRVDPDGWQRVERRRVPRRADPQLQEQPPQPEAPPRRCFPKVLDGRCLNCLSFKHRVASCRQPSRCLRCHGLRHRAKDCTRPRRPPPRSGQPRLDGRVAPFGNGHGRARPLTSDGGALSAAVGGLSLTLSATYALAVVALSAAKSTIVAALNIKEDVFTLRPAFPKLFVATFRSREIRDRASVADISLERPSGVGSVLGQECLARDCAVEQAAIAEVDLDVVDVAATPVPPVEVLADHSLVPPSVELTEPASVEVTATIVVPGVDRSVALEAFINNVTKDISPPLLADKPPRRRQVDPVLVDAPPQLPSSEASGIRRSHRQAVDPLSAVKPAKRGEVLVMHRLGEVGVPLPSMTSADQAVKKFFQDPPPHQLDALSDMFPMLKNKSKTSPFMGLSVD
ncbi:unnamed protein product [Urochloa humidicola]